MQEALLGGAMLSLEYVYVFDNGCAKNYSTGSELAKYYFESKQAGATKSGNSMLRNWDDWMDG